MRVGRVTALLAALCVVTLIGLASANIGWPWRTAAMLLALGVFVALGFAIRRALRQQELLVVALADGLNSLNDADYSVSIAEPSEPRLQRLVSAYNLLGTRLRNQRQDLYQRELLLDTVIQASPVALLLTNSSDVILYANLAARQVLSGGRKLEGLMLAPLLEPMPAALREALSDDRDRLFTATLGTDAHVFHVSHRRFLLNGQPHRLRLLKQLTREVNAQEVATWKRVIRVIAHEINNSVAPIASLSQSGQRLAEQPDSAQLRRVFGAIEERMAHLSQFVEGYSRFAKLPMPRPAEVDWSRFIGSLQAVSPFTVEGPLPDGRGWFDESQLEQVLINLVKNAREAGSAVTDIVLAVRPMRGGWGVELRDRGGGMSEDVLTNALLPFYSTKPAGGGLGLTLCREIVEAHGGTLELGNRTDGELGAVVRFWLPPAPTA